MIYHRPLMIIFIVLGVRDAQVRLDMRFLLQRRIKEEMCVRLNDCCAGRSRFQNFQSFRPIARSRHRSAYFMADVRMGAGILIDRAVPLGSTRAALRFRVRVQTLSVADFAAEGDSSVKEDRIKYYYAYSEISFARGNMFA